MSHLSYLDSRLDKIHGFSRQRILIFTLILGTELLLCISIT